MCLHPSGRARSRWPGFAAEPPSYVLELYGVLLHDDAALPGAERLLGRLRAVGSRFVVATNDSVRSPAELSVLLTRAGLAVPAELVWTAALTAARFVATQHPDGSAFAVGSPALTEALRQVGYRVSDSAPDYVLLGDGPLLRHRSGEQGGGPSSPRGRGSSPPPRRRLGRTGAARCPPPQRWAR